ncbi:uncharacterized protein LOC127721088 [Mytilus californianus]|uniref:uncharacterized protein LOC127721088 n=1 Tax=Mytilus californianus TaxID=6549 RepID=UPI002245BE87|nr:uncharacterized protein LOC127721088 [Mytilus californianus]
MSLPLEPIVFEDATSSRALEVMHLEQTSPTSPVLIFQSSKSNAMGNILCWIEDSHKLLPESSTLVKSDFIKFFWIDLIMDKRIDNRINKPMEQYKGFDIFLNCNGFVLNCNVDKRLHTSIMTCTAIPLETFINRKRKMSDFETLMLTLHHVRRQTLSTQFWTDIFLPVVENRSSILCQFLLTAISEVETRVWQECHLYLMDGLSRAMTNQDKDTAKSIAWFITRKFFLSLRSNFLENVIDIWPAFQCKCLDKKQVLFCCQTVAIIVEVDKLCPELPNGFSEIEVKYILKDNINNGECSKVHEHLQNLSSKITCNFPNKISISGMDSKHLFDEHTNLSLICKSPFKSTGFRTNNHMIIKQPCIQLYCKKKGFIPIGENHFPRTVFGMQTDILDGSPRFVSHLKVGDQIGTDGYKRGTLGGFVKVRGDTAFLTCLHVFLNADELASDNLSLDDEQTVWVKCYRENSSILCGKIREMAFEVDNEKEISIDAALIELKEGITIEASDYVSSTDVNFPFSSIGMFVHYLI